MHSAAFVDGVGEWTVTNVVVSLLCCRGCTDTIFTIRLIAIVATVQQESTLAVPCGTVVVVPGWATGIGSHH